MKKTTALAAALAAAMTSFAAHAQEAPDLAIRHQVGVGVPVRAEAVKAEPPSLQRLSVPAGAAEDRGMHHYAHVASAAVDSATTASVRRPPEKPVTEQDAKPKGRYHHLIARHAAAYGVPVDLAHAVVRIESNYRANARGRAGEIGLMQIKPRTARGLGFTGSTKALYDPDVNLRYGLKYLAVAHQLGDGDICRTILKYNAGHGAKRMNPTSAAYCAKVKRYLGNS